MSTVRRAAPYTWCTWIVGLLSGDDHCAYAPWFKSHHQYDKLPRDGNLAAWRSDHAVAVGAQIDRLIAAGYAVSVEDQNKMVVRGKTTTLSCCPDIIAVDATEALVVDCKTGQRRDKDRWQLIVYLAFVRHAFREFIGDRPLRGELHYGDGIVPVASSEVDVKVTARIAGLLRAVGAPDPPPATPSARECRWCDIADCTWRVADEDRTVETDVF